MKINFVPYNDMVLVRPTENNYKTPAGIIVPDTTTMPKATTGQVVVVGPGKYSKKGVLIPVSVKVGDEVLFPRNCFDEITLDGKDFYLMSESAILGKFV